MLLLKVQIAEDRCTSWLTLCRLFSFDPQRNCTCHVHRASLFDSTAALSNAVAHACHLPEGEDAEERSSKRRERLVALVKRHLDSLPSTSSSATVTDSYDGLQVVEDLVDVLWTADQALESGSNAGAATESAASAPTHLLALLVKDLNVSLDW